MRDLVFGRGAQLEEIVRSGASASMAALLATEARQGTAVLLRRPGYIGLVEVEDKADAALPRLALDERFRIEFPLLRRGRYVAVLQNAQQAWVVLGASMGSAPKPVVHVPGGTVAGKPGFLRERRDVGRHRFVCLETSAPFPAFVDEHRREGTTLDKAGLDALAAVFLTILPSPRACQLLVVSVEPGSAA